MTTLKQATQSIIKLENSNENNSIKVAKLIGEINSKKLYKDEFGTAANWANTQLGWSRSNLNQYVGLSKVIAVVGDCRMEVSRVIKPLVCGKNSDAQFIADYTSLAEGKEAQGEGMLTMKEVEAILPDDKKSDKSIEEKIKQAYSTVEAIMQSGVNGGELTKKEARTLVDAHIATLNDMFKGE